MPNPYIKKITIRLPDGQGGSTVYDLKPVTLNVTGSGNAIASLSMSDYLLTATKGTYLTSHPTITTYTDTTSTISPGVGGSFTVVDSVTRETNGHVQRINLKTVTLPSSSVTVDTALSTSSTNPVENRVVTNYKPGLVNQTTKGETFGASTSALGSYASAHGTGTTASGNNQMVIGQYNYEDTNNDYVFIIGNGARTGVTTVYSNAFTVDWSGNTTMFGNAFVKGDYIYMGSNDDITLARYNIGSNTHIDKTNMFAMAPFPTFKYQNGSDVGIVPIIGGIGTSQLSEGTGLIKTPWTRAYMRYGTTSQEGIAGLYLGNGYKAGVEGNAYGEMRICTAGTAQTSATSTNKPYIKLVPPTLTGVIPNYTVYWPSRAGTLALEEYTVAGTYDSNGRVTIPNVAEIQFTEWVPDMGMQPAGVLRGGGTGIGNASFSLPNNANGGMLALYSDITSYHPTTSWTSSTSTISLSFGGTFEVDRVNKSSGDLDGHGHIVNGETIKYKLPSLGAGTGISIGSNGYTINHSNSVTAQTNYNKYKYKYDAQGHITASSYVVHSAAGTGGSSGWIKIASFKITNTYFNTPVTLICSHRGNTRTFQISFGFTNANTTDPELKFFELSCIPSCAGWTTTQAYLIKSATSTWDLYVLKHDNYEAFVVNDFIVGAGEYFTNHVTWTWKDEQAAASTITGGTAATNRVSLGMTYANNYYGMAAGTDDTQWIRTTTIGILPYQSGNAGSGHSSIGTSNWYFANAYIDNIHGTHFYGTSDYADKLSDDAGGEITPIYIANGVPTNCKTSHSGATWNIVPTVQPDGVMEIGRYIDFHSVNTGTTDYDIRLDCSDSSNLIMTSSGGSQAFTIKGVLPRFRFQQTTSGKTYSTNVLVGYPASSNGINLVMGAGGNTIIGSGDSHTSFYNLANKSTSYPDYWGEDDELAYFTSDSTIVLLTNCNTIANRKAFTFGTNFGLPPGGRIRFMHSDESTSSGLLNGANANTTSRTWTLPDETGTIALITQTDANALINTLSTGTSTPEDDDYYVSQYAGGGTTTTTYHRRSMLALYKYLCNKRTGYIEANGSTVSGSANNWFRIAYSTSKSAYSDIEGIFVINYAYSNALCGILKVRGRTEGTAGTFGSTKAVQWLVKDDGLDGNNICVIFANNKGSDSATVSGSACIEIWVKATQQYDTITCTILSGFGRDTGTNTDWTWYTLNRPATTGSTSLPTYASQTNVYATTEMGITAYDVTYKTPTPSGKVNSQWGTTAERTRLVTKGWMSYWDGSYDGTTSNLTYCNRGAFGTIVTHAADDYIGAVNANNYYGMAAPDGTDTVWIRTTNQGLIPYEKGGSGSGHQSIGTSTWYFAHAYIDTVHGSLSGNASTASQVYSTLTNPSSASTYYVPFHSGASSANKSLLNNNGLWYYTLGGTTSAVGEGTLCLGNSTASGTAGNKRGFIRLYGTGSGYQALSTANTSSTSYTATFPAKTGNVGLYTVLYTSTTAPSALSGSINANSSTTVVGNYDIIKVWIYVGSTSMIKQVDICCTTIALAQAPHYFSTGASYNTKYINFSSNGYTLNYATAGSSDSTKISIAKVIGVRFN